VVVYKRLERGTFRIPVTPQAGQQHVEVDTGELKWGEVFGDPVVATAILDRLLHHSHVLTIRGESYRLKEKADDGSITDRRVTTSRERFTAVFGERPRARILLEAGTESEWVARHA